MCNMIRNTMIVGFESERKQPRMNSEIINRIDEITPNNKKYTRGVVVYELLKFADYEGKYENDMIDDYENEIDNKLDNEIKNISYHITKVGEDAPDYDTSQNKQVSIWLPANIVYDLSGRGYSQDIIDSLIEYESKPYRDREHRVQVKKNILDYIKSDNPNRNEYDTVTNDIIDGKYKNNTVAGKLDDKDLVWWQQYDVTASDMARRAGEVKKTKSARINFLKEYLIQYRREAKQWAREHNEDESKIVNDWLPNTKKEIIEMINKFWNVSQPTEEDYTEEIIKFYEQ